MKLIEEGPCAIYMIGGGGMGMSHPTDSHSYVVDDGHEAAMIDTGSGIQPELMLENLRADGIPINRIRKILLTHAHWDHGRGSAWWQNATGGAEIMLHPLGRSTIEEGTWSDTHIAKHGITSQAATVTRTLADGDEICVGTLRLTALHTPGHSDDSVSFFMQLGKRTVLFGGDTCFVEGGHGTVSAETDFRAYRDSVRRLAALNVDVLLPGHKQFVLARGAAHIEQLNRKLSGRWTDVVCSRVPFFPTWWLEHDASLYDDAR